jgi:CysZ protein
LILYLAFVFGDNLGEGLFSWYKWDFGQGVISAIDDWIGVLIIGIFAIIIFKYIVLIVASPFMSYLSEQLERQMDSYPAHSNFILSEALADLKRGIVLNMRNFIREILTVGLLFLLGLIPLLTIFVPILIFIIQAYYAGFGNLDYFLERHYKVRGSVRFVRNHKFLAIGNGAIFLGLLMIPVIGWFIAPFFATIAGTLAAVSRVKAASSST